jgi:anti-sigma B factor antagonist
MTVVESVMGKVTVLAPLGERLDAAGCGEFRSRLEQVVARGQRFIALDLGAVRFMDSTGLAVILSALRNVAGQGRIACAGAGVQVRKLFEVTKLDRGLLSLHSTVDQAVDALARSQARPGGGGGL